MALSHISSSPVLRRLFAVGLAVIIAIGAVAAITGTASATTQYGCAPYCEPYSPPPEPKPAPPPAPPADSTGFGDLIGDIAIGVAGSLVGVGAAAQYPGDALDKITAGVVAGTATSIALDRAGVDERIAEPIEDVIRTVDDAITEARDVLRTSCDTASRYTGLGAPCGR